jgi:hypothetical protein
MEAHIRALLHRFQDSEQFKETAAFRVIYGSETLSQVMADLDIHNSYAQLGEPLPAQGANRLVRYSGHDANTKMGRAGLAVA